MIEVWVELGSATACFTVLIRAESIRLIDPESFFVKDPITSARLIDLEMLESLAG